MQAAVAAETEWSWAHRAVRPEVGAFIRKSGKSRMSEDIEQSRTADFLSELVRDVAEHHNREAFASLFQHFAPRLNSHLRRQGASPESAEEVVQETMVNVWNKASQFDPSRASVSTWVYTIARNMRIDMLRKANRPEPDMNDPAIVPDPEPHAADAISLEQEAVRLRSALENLPDEQRIVLQLAFYEEKAHAEIAEELGIPLGTVKSRIRLAMKRVRTEFGARE